MIEKNIYFSNHKKIFFIKEIGNVTVNYLNILSPEIKKNIILRYMKMRGEHNIFIIKRCWNNENIDKNVDTSKIDAYVFIDTHEFINNDYSTYIKKIVGEDKPSLLLNIENPEIEKEIISFINSQRETNIGLPKQKNKISLFWYSDDEIEFLKNLKCTSICLY